MRPPSRLVVFSTGFLAALFASFFAGRWSVGTGDVASNPKIPLPQKGGEGQALVVAGGSKTLTADKAVGRAGGGQVVINKPDGAGNMDALRAAMQEKRPTLKMQQFLTILDQLTAAEMPEAIKYLNDLPEDTGREMSMALNHWAQTDALAALNWLDTQDNRMKGWAGQEVMKTWAEKDPNAAIAWAKQKGAVLPQGQANPWLAGAISGMAPSEPALAADLTASLPYSRERGVALEAVVDSFFRNNPDGAAARQWAESLPETDAKFKQGALGRVADAWAAKSPEKAAAWVDTLPQGMRGRALASVVGTWADTDPNAAGTWLGKFPAGVERNEAVVNFAYTVRDQDPEASMIWAGTISDDRQRDEMSVRLARDWMQRDAATARAWIQNAKVPESTKELMLKSTRG